ncbi:hypothetical protein [Argonema galeatum]|uniref:hypothetical protein n=1 Tax=Argonema galeatum TaxID=2942762 RepID=UPI0020112D32|nr:hypothetical protein [Argonema galeatum]MCL1465651.1 hypothetical protein [Argonema galeatum A003/A1]
MRVWLASFLLLFALAQLFEWMKHLALPLPVFIVGGVFLALASNYDKRSGWPFRGKISESQPSQNHIPTVIESLHPPSPGNN